MFNFIHRLLNPHCPHCEAKEKELREFQRSLHIEEKEERHEDLVCQSCETLKMQLAIANDEKKTLLDRLLEKPAVPVHQGPPAITRQRMPSALPWPARRQLLENEDRRKAELLASAPKPDSATPLVENESTEAIEREILAVESAGNNNV